MTNLSKKEIMATFYRATMEALGYNPDKRYGKQKPPVRLSYSAYGKPDWGIGEDVIFLAFNDVSDETTQPVHTTFEYKADEIIRRHWSNRVVQINFTAYGPKCYDRLLKLRHIFMDGSSILRKADLMMIPSADVPQYAPELYQNMWWERADLALRFNNTVIWDESVSTIEKVPITIKDNPSHTDRVHTDSGIIIKKG